MGKVSKRHTPTPAPACTREPAPLPTWRAGFLAALEAGGNISQAARAVGISRRHAYRVRSEDEDFAADWDEALKVATDALEEEARKLATGEYWSYKFDKHGNALRHPETGEPYRERVVHAPLLHVLLKAHRPELYGDRLKLDTGKDAPAYDLSKLTAEELALLEQLTHKASPPQLP